MAVLVGLQTTPLNLSHSLFPTSPSVVQSLCSHTNRVDHSRFPSTLLTADCSRWRPTIHRRPRLLLPLLSPTTLVALQTNCSATTTTTSCRLSPPALQTNCFATTTTTLFAGSLRRLSSWLQTDSSLRNYCLKVGEGERYSRHLPQLFIYALKRVGYRGDVCCLFHNA
jgi:hypothetical protein